MYKVMNYKKGKKTGKGFLIVLSCLIFLSGTVAFPMTVFGKVISSFVPKEENEEDGRFRHVGGFDNPIDDRYLALIYAGAQEDDIANINGVLIDYENEWRTQTENYLEEYRFQCKHQGDKDMVDEYLFAVKEAVSAQKDLMEYLGMEEAAQHWYAAQIYRCSFVKGIRGTFAEEESVVMNVDIRKNYASDISDFVYKEYGEFENKIDRKYAVHMFDGCEAEVRAMQEEFDLAWCDQLSQLTMEFYETLDEEGKHLADAWQVSRERWKEAFSNRFWWSPEELNAVSYENSFWGIGTRAGILEVDGWINRLYYLQLEKMMEKASDRGEKNVEKCLA